MVIAYHNRKDTHLRRDNSTLSLLFRSKWIANVQSSWALALQVQLGGERCSSTSQEFLRNILLAVC
jgi:hypothetical protein